MPLDLVLITLGLFQRKSIILYLLCQFLTLFKVYSIGNYEKYGLISSYSFYMVGITLLADTLSRKFPYSAPF